MTRHGNAARPESALWRAIPPVEIDVLEVRKRGRRLRLRRRAIATSACVAALALAGGLALGVSQLPGPPVAPAATEDASATASDPPSDESPSTPTQATNDTEPTTSTTEEQPSGSQAPEIIEPRLTESALRALAIDAGLSTEWVNAEGNMLDAGLADSAGTQISVTITAASPDQVIGAIENALAKRTYQEGQLGDVTIYFKPASGPGDSAQWIFASPDGTEMFSVIAAPPGTAADANSLSETSIRVVDEQLLPLLAAS